MSMMCFSQNTNRSCISDIPHTPLFQPCLEKRGFWVLSLKQKEEAELMPDQNSTGDKVKFCCDKTPSCSKPHQGLFRKQYGALQYRLVLSSTG